MANIVFQGPAALTLDGKGRIAVPARHRELLTAMGCNQLTITKHPEGSLMIFPRPAWEAFRDKVAALPMEAGSQPGPAGVVAQAVSAAVKSVCP